MFSTDNLVLGRQLVRVRRLSLDSESVAGFGCLLELREEIPGQRPMADVVDHHMSVDFILLFDLVCHNAPGGIKDEYI